MRQIRESGGENIRSLVSAFASKSAFDQAVRHYLNMNKNPESPVWRVFTKDNVLVLISGKVPEEDAREYEKVLINLDKE